MKTEVGDKLKNAHTGEIRTVTKVGGGSVSFGDNDLLDRWTQEDINIHWQNLTKGEPEKKFGEAGYMGHRIGSIISSDILSFTERKEFPHDIAVNFKRLPVAKLRARGNGWNLETLDIIHSFWMGGVIKQFSTLEEAKEGTIKWFEQWWNR